MEREACHQASTRATCDMVWDPHTQSARPCMITNLFEAPDTFWYGKVVVEVSWSPTSKQWSGPVCH